MIALSKIQRKKAALLEVQRNMRRKVRKGVEATKIHLEEMNIRQLSRGERSDGSKLPDYSNVSVEQYGKPPGPMRLYDEGDFYEGIDSKTSSSGVEVAGTDSKTDMLQEYYGNEIIGVSEDHQKEYAHKRLRPALIKDIRESLSS